MKKLIVLIVFLLPIVRLFAQSTDRAENLIVITIDGARWNEVFGGADSVILYGAAIPHSNKIWFAIMGPGISPLGEMKVNANLYQNQFAPTMTHLLGLQYQSPQPIGARIENLNK